MAEYKIGDEIEVEMPDGFRVGRVVTVLPNYAWSAETKYSIHGKGFVTIASARVIREIKIITKHPRESVDVSAMSRCY